MIHSAGSIYRRQDGRWVAALVVDGKRKVLYAKSEKGARQKLAELQRQAALAGGLPDPGRRTVNDLLDLWLETTAPTLKPRTLAEYEAICNRYLRPALGHVRLGRLTPERIQKLYADLQARGLKRAPQATHVALHSALKLAVRWRWLPNNPAELTAKPRYQAQRRQVWDREQLRAFLAATEGHRLGPLWALAVATGCRLSELLALKWQDVDLKAGTVHVHAALHRVKGRWVEATPKTKAGTRTIALPPEGIAALRRQKQQQNEWRLRAGPRWQDCGRVFTNLLGQPLEPARVQDAMRAECARLGLPRLTPHSLRHMHASLLLAQGLPITTVSARLGHASPNVTLGIYAHALGDADRQAAQALERALGK